LEDRTAPAGFTVVNTGDAGVGNPATNEGDLRWCINQANVTRGPNDIGFDIGVIIPGLPGTPKTIVLTAPLLTITNTVSIDGFSQEMPNAPSQPMIELDGAGFSGGGIAGAGLVVNTTGAVTIQGLAIDRFAGNGITIQSPAGAAGTTIAGCYIGTTQDGNAKLGNGSDGIRLSGASGNTIGGTADGAGNVISGNGIPGGPVSEGFGISLEQNSTGNLIEGNVIGLNKDETAKLGNSLDGIYLEVGSDNNTIGGSYTSGGNYISGNGGSGIDIRSSYNVVAGNDIGIGNNNAANLGNTGDGVLIYGSNATGNTIGGTLQSAQNVISDNGGFGVNMDGGAAGNTVQNDIIGYLPDGITLKANGKGWQGGNIDGNTWINNIHN
jgi:titin